MNIKNIPVIAMIILLTACGNSHTTKNTGKEEAGKSAATAPDSTVAVKFINAYLASFGQAADGKKWLKQNGLVTDRFITTYTQMVEQAWKDDPEMGLGFDPIIAAQDAPEKVEMESFDAKTGYVTVRGVDWPDFRIVLKIVQEKDRWLVDGAGVINIPADKQLR